MVGRTDLPPARPPTLLCPEARLCSSPPDSLFWGSLPSCETNALLGAPPGLSGLQAAFRPPVAKKWEFHTRRPHPKPSQALCSIHIPDNVGISGGQRRLNGPTAFRT